MKKQFKTNLFLSLSLFTVFIIYTLSVKFIDVALIGNKLSPVGFSSLNNIFFDLFSKKRGNSSECTTANYVNNREQRIDR